MDYYNLEFDDGIGQFQTMTTTPRTFPLDELTDVRVSLHRQSNEREIDLAVDRVSA